MICLKVVCAKCVSLMDLKREIKMQVKELVRVKKGAGNILGLPPGSRFSNKEILIFMLPIFLEQLMITGMGMADTFMVSSLGESAVAGVSLVTSVDKFVRLVFTALAAGGSVVLSQYIGAQNDTKSEEALRSCVHVVFVIGCAVSAVMLVLNRPILGFLFGNAEPEVVEASQIYFFCTASSYPLMALYNAGTASYRAMGNSRIPFIASLAMMIVNLGLKYIFIFVLHMGVAGAGFSTTLGMGLVGIVLMFLLRRPCNKIHIRRLFCFRYDWPLIGRIFKVSIPNAIENGMFQFGLIVLSGLVSTLGTASIAAHGIATNITPMLYCISTGFSMSLMVIVGQCMGAGEAEEASMYIRHVTKLCYIFLALNGLIFALLSGKIISLFGISEEAEQIAMQILHMYNITCLLLYPSAFGLPYGLRGAGDTKFVMAVSIASMFLCRIAMSYVFVQGLQMGVMGIWYAQAVDWLVRSAAFWARYLRGRWKTIKVIE